jgi:thymidylate synthase
MGDTHLYSEHYSAALRQVDRIPFHFPTLSFPDISSLSDLEKLESKDFKLKDYKSHPKITAKMAV